MDNKNKTKEQLIEELTKSYKFIVQLEEVRSKYKTLTKDLNLEHKQLLSIFDSIDEVIYVVDPQTYEVLYVNRVFRERFGEVKGKKCYRVFQALEFPCSFCTNDRILGENVGKTYVWDFQNRFNQRWYHCIDRAINWPDGRIVRCEIAIDITERKNLENKLRTLEAAVEQSIDGIAVADMEGIIQFCNSSWANMHGYEAKELINKHLSMFHTEAQIRDEVIHFNEKVKEKGSHCGQIGHVKKDGTTFTTWMTTTLMKDADAKPIGLIGIARYITSRQ